MASASHSSLVPQTRLGLPAVLVLAALVYAPALDNGLSLDDFNWLQRVSQVGPTSFVEFLLERESGQLLNPVPRLVLLLAWQVFGASPLPLHVALFVLHLVNVALVWVVGRRLVSAGCGFVAAAVFAVHPGPQEAVFWLAAFFHPLCTFFVLLALLALGALSHSARKAAPHQGPAPPRSGLALAFVVVALLALLTKAVGFALVPGVLLLVWLRRDMPAVALRPLVVLGAAVVCAAVLVLCLNLRLGVLDSYLFERGLYAPGPHWGANLWEYAANLGLPYAELAHRLGEVPGAAFEVTRHLAAGAVLVLLAGAALRGDWRRRWLAGLVVFAILPVLPFTLEPTSRYLYLPTAPFSLLLASVVTSSRLRQWRGAVAPAQWMLSGLLAAWCLASWAEVRLTDNRYEYREEQASQWLEQILGLYPHAPRRLVIVGLPTQGIDPGIHLEAALRLRWAAPSLQLEVVTSPADEVTSRGRGAAVLRYTEDGRHGSFEP